MKDLTALLEHGMVTLYRDDGLYAMIYEPDWEKCPPHKQTTVLIRNLSIFAAVKTLQIYLKDPYRGATDFPAAFFDPFQNSNNSSCDSF